MQKSQIISFIKRYYLGNKTEATQWDTFDDKLEAHFITLEKSCMGIVRLNNFKDFEPGQTIGILNTTPIIRQLETLNESKQVDAVFTKLEKEGMEVRIAAVELIESSNGIDPYSTQFMCADLKVVPRNTGLKKTPEWDLLFTLNNEFIDKFVKAQPALEAEEFQLINKSGKYKIIVGQQNTRHSTMNETPLDVKNEVDKIVKFPAPEMKEILSANKGGDIKLHISGEGLAWVEVKETAEVNVEDENGNVVTDEKGDPKKETIVQFECDYYLLSEG